MSKQLLVKTLTARGLDDLAARAEKGEFSDFASEHDMPVSMLVRELEKVGAGDLAERARRGDFDHDR